MLGKIHCADAGKFISALPDQCVDFVMTSPPYWGLRDYGVKGQIGLERHPQDYIDKLVAIFQDLKRVLKPHGSLYLNLGDTYYGGSGGNNFDSDTGSTAGGSRPGKRKIGGAGFGHIARRDKNHNGNWLRPKQLLLIPARVAIAMQEDGWILRNAIVWYKPNGLPSSVKDRLSNKYEHVFHFVKSRRYYYDLDSIRVPQETLKLAGSSGRARNHQIYNPYDGQTGIALGWKGPGGMVAGARAQRRIGALWLLRVDGKNPGDVISARNKTADLSKLRSMRNPPEPDQSGAFHPLGKNPGDIYENKAKDLDFWKEQVLNQYAQIGKTGGKRFSGKNELLDEASAGYRLLWNSGQMRNCMYAIIDSLAIPLELRQKLKNWWHDHSGHFLGPNPGDFWRISTRPFPEAHFAVYPEELCVRPIPCSCPPFVCKACGRPPMPVPRKRSQRSHVNWRLAAAKMNMPIRTVVAHVAGGHTGRRKASHTGQVSVRKSCNCNAGFEPGIVFDPFAGAGTTLLVAKKLGRRWFGCELNPKFVKMVTRRLRETDQ